MAFPTAVNDQATDAVTQVNLQTVGSASAMAAGTVLQTAAQAVAMSMQNATAQQQATNMIANAVLSRIAKTLTSR